MRRFIILLVIMLVAGTTIALAEEDVLIDFDNLRPDLTSEYLLQPENERTLVDFSAAAGTSFVAEERAAMKISLTMNNWEVKLASSSRFISNVTRSMTKAAPVLENAAQYAGQTILGVRIHFPEESYNSWARVQPPYSIPANADYSVFDQDDGTMTVPEAESGKRSKFLNGHGVLRNVGTIKQIKVNFYGMNFPYTMSVMLEDENDNETEYHIGSVERDGWATLVWDNPNYLEDARDREVEKRPLYPNATPVVKIGGFVFYRGATQVGGDFICYIKDVSLVYDKAVLDLESDIDNEELWGILQTREEARTKAENSRLGELQVLRFLEKRKMHEEETTLEEAVTTE